MEWTKQQHQQKHQLQGPSASEDAIDPFSLENMLDWYCLHLDAKDLPTLFVDTDIKNKAMENSTMKVELLEPSVVSNESDTTKTKESQRSDPSFDAHKSFLLKHAIDSEKDESKARSATNDEGNQADHKAWILSMYEYDNGEDVAKDTETVQDTADGIPAQHADGNQDLPVKESTPFPEEARLAKMEKELAELRASANDDASNYMRSKHEVKALKKEVSKLQGSVKKLQAKVAKMRLKRQQEAEEIAGTPITDDTLEPDSSNQTKDDADEANIGGFGGDLFGTNHSDEEDEGGPGVRHTMDRRNQAATTTSKDHETDPEPESKEEACSTKPVDILSRSTPAIPIDWTGSTPKNVLFEYCKRKRLPRPTFPKNKRVKERLQLVVKTIPDPISLEYEGPFHSVEDGQNLLAMKALFKISPDLPLYQMFPPVFRNIWKTWIDHVATDLKQHELEERASKEKLIQRLIDLIPKEHRVGLVDIESKRSANEASHLDNQMAGMQNSNKSDGPLQSTSVSDVSQNDRTVSSAAGKRLQLDFTARRKSKQYVTMLKSRESLPMNSYRATVLETISENNVTVLCAETGAGKTTQCPQYLLEDALLNGSADKVSIVCTQPRRISAMSVAERVAHEMCDKIGGLVGYQIRMESKRSKSTKLMFCTTGVLLRRIQDDPNLNGVTHVVVDEVHERQWQIDFLLVALRRLIHSTRPNLKVVLVSRQCVVMVLPGCRSRLMPFVFALRFFLPYSFHFITDVPFLFGDVRIDVGNARCQTVLFLLRRCTRGERAREDISRIELLP